MMNGNGNGSTSPGFVAVNARPVEGNGTSELSRGGATDNTKSELIKQFSTVRLMRRIANGELYPSASSIAISPGRSLGGTPSSKLDMSSDFLAFGPPTNGNNPNMFSASTSTPKADDGPYKAEMMNRMESIKRGDRVVPPCDRCRRLHMDCIKNLTACLGCTKKHAKCGWRDVHPDELSGTAPPSLPVDDMDPDNALEFLQKRDAGNGIAAGDSPMSASNADMAAADLAEVAEVAKAALESTETDLAHHPRDQGHDQDHHVDHHAQHHHMAVQIQSPNMAAPITHQSPNIPPYGSFSPHPASVNIPYAQGRRASSPLQALSGEDVSDDKFDMSVSDKDPIDGRPVESLLTS
jgi:hypothetical protein